MKHIFSIALLLLSFIVFSQPTSFSPKGIGGGGALFFPRINPANDNEFYVSCDMSELFHSTDFGDSYSQIHYSKLQVFNTSTYEFTNDPQIAYCSYNDGNTGYPVKTTDGGNTWNNISAYDVNTYGNIYTMSANYNNPLQLLIGAYGDILFSNDGGASFTLVKHAANNGAGLIMGGVFWEGNNIYIGTNDGLITSNNAGSNFAVQTTTGIPAGQMIWSFAGAQSGSTTKFTCITANTADVYNGIMPWDYYTFAKGVYTMDNDNGTWVSKSAGIDFNNDFIMYVGMAQNNIDTIYLGGEDNASGGPLVYKSINAGTSWNKVFNTTNNSNIITGWEGASGDKAWSWSETCFGITVAPNNANKVLFGSYSNVESTSDGGITWKQAYVDTADQHAAGTNTPTKTTYKSIGLENTTCWQVHWKDANNMIASFSDIGCIRSTDTGNKWSFNYNGFSVNSLYRVEEAPNGTLYGACSNIHDMYQSTRLADAQLDVADANGKIVFSSDNGANWTTLHSFGHPVFWIAIDPNNADRMYASVIQYGGTAGSQVGGIYMTNNLSAGAASTWTKLANPPRTEGHPACIQVLNNGKMVCTFSGRRNSGGTFTNSSGVFVYDPGNTTWTDISDTGMHYWTKDIIIDPSDATQNTWYVAVFSGWGGAPNGLGGLYKTINSGTSWTKLTASQFDRATSITFNPQNVNQAYLTTETQGLWISSDMNVATPTWTVVNSYPFRQPERVFFNPFNQNEMWVTSFGNGMKVGSLTTSCIPPAAPTASNKTICYGNTASLSSSGTGILGWYNMATGGTYIGGSANYTTPALFSDATYYAQDSTCAASATRKAVVVKVNSLPTVTANSNAASVCAGTSVTLTGGGAASYTWTGGVSDGISFIPSSNNTYTVTGTDVNNCSNTDTIIVNVNTLPTPTVTANSSANTLCAGNPVTLTGSGAASYTWTNGVIDGMAFVPSSPYSYTVIGTNGNNCFNTATINIHVNSLPVVIANASTGTICKGSSATLTGSGANTYSWTGGVMEGISFIPSSTDTYTVTGTDANNCSNTAAITVNIDTLPNLTTTLNGVIITANQNGAAYQWLNCNNGNLHIANATNQNYTATTNGNYAVIITMNTCSDTSACVNINTVSVDEIINNDQLTIYPNPVNDILYFSTLFNTPISKINIYDTQGRLLISELAKGNFISTNSLGSGIYFITFIFRDNSIIYKKIVK